MTNTPLFQAQSVHSEPRCPVHGLSYKSFVIVFTLYGTSCSFSLIHCFGLPTTICWLPCILLMTRTVGSGSCLRNLLSLSCSAHSRSTKEEPELCAGAYRADAHATDTKDNRAISHVKGRAADECSTPTPVAVLNVTYIVKVMGEGFPDPSSLLESGVTALVYSSCFCTMLCSLLCANACMYTHSHCAHGLGVGTNKCCTDRM